MHDQGLVEAFPHRGAFVLQMTPEKAVEVFDLRQLLQSHAIAIALRNGPVDDETLRALTAAFSTLCAAADGGDAAAVIEADMEFHRLASAASHQTVLLRAPENSAVADTASRRPNEAVSLRPPGRGGDAQTDPRSDSCRRRRARRRRSFETHWGHYPAANDQDGAGPNRTRWRPRRRESGLSPANSTGLVGQPQHRLRVDGHVGEIVTPILAFLAFVVVWEAAVDIFRIPQYILPTPSQIIGQFGPYGFAIWPATLVTLSETLLGFAAAIVFAVPLAMLVAFSPFLSRTFYPGAVALEMVPKIAFAPLFVTWFGFGYPPKILIVVLVCFFPILLNGILAFKSLSMEIMYLSRSTGASSWRMFWKIRLPAALPTLFVGLKGAATNATVGAVIAEWIGGNDGLGYVLQVDTGYLRLDRAFACILVLTVMGLSVFLSVVLAERALIPWHVSQRVFGRSTPVT